MRAYILVVPAQAGTQRGGRVGSLPGPPVLCKCSLWTRLRGLPGPFGSAKKARVHRDERALFEHWEDNSTCLANSHSAIEMDEEGYLVASGSSLLQLEPLPNALYTMVNEQVDTFVTIVDCSNSYQARQDLLLSLGEL